MFQLHNNPTTRVQTSVHHNWHQVIKHILFLNFIQLQYVFPLSSSSKSRAVYSYPSPKIQCLVDIPSSSVHSWDLCKNDTRKYRDKTVIHMVNVLHHIFNAKWTPMMTQIFHRVQCWLEHNGQLLIISTELKRKRVDKTTEFSELGVWTQW